MEKVYIYVLSLVNNKYYVGKTKNISNRLENHFADSGSYWTKKYKPISVLEIYENCDVYDEDKYTIMYMNKYGIDNVRGGSFTTLYLSLHETLIINKMIDGANDKCFKCGLSHFANFCSKAVTEKYTYKKIIIDKIKNNCALESRNICINIDILVKILLNISDEIFCNMTACTVKNLCKKYSMSNIIFDNTINYIHFCDNVLFYIF